MPRDKLKLTPAAEGSGYQLDEQAGFLMRVAMQRHTSIFTAHMVEGLTQTQFAALAKLHEVGACSQNHLGRLIYLDAATIKGVVDRLSLRGFVTALSDPNDRRRRAVDLTDRFREVTESSIKVSFDFTGSTLTPLTPEEQRTIGRLLKKIG